MTPLIEHLQSFNRKERLAVIQNALGIESNTVTLGEPFRKNLYDSLGGDPAIPSSVFLAADYHLDWIEVAILRATDPHISLRTPFESPNLRINENQQDIDLLLAFSSSVNGRDLTDLVLIEAKAYTGWNNKQLQSKVQRLHDIFGGEDASKYSNVLRPWFVLMTPREAQGVEHEYWPRWMKPEGHPRWMIYDLPSRKKITRCTKDGRWSKNGKYLVIDPIQIGTN